jgi:shikimate kinase
MALLFVVGPSNVGKSTLLGMLMATTGCRVITSDDSVSKRHGSAGKHLPAVGNKRFFEDTVDCVRKDTDALANGDVIIDVGAGALQYAKENFAAVEEWLKTGKIIAILDDPVEIAKRDKLNRSLDDYSAIELSNIRNAIYGLADRLVNVQGRTAEAAFPDLKEAVTALLPSCGLDGPKPDKAG